MEMMQCVKVGKLNLVDLAGSERVHITGATGEMSTMQRIFVGFTYGTRQLLLQQGCWQSSVMMSHVKLMAVTAQAEGALDRHAG